MESIMLGLEIARRLASKAGLYLVVEILLPGGPLLALLLYHYSRRSNCDKGIEVIPARPRETA